MAVMVANIFCRSLMEHLMLLIVAASLHHNYGNGSTNSMVSLIMVTHVDFANFGILLNLQVSRLSRCIR